LQLKINITFQSFSVNRISWKTGDEAGNAANFFMIPPLDLFIDMEEDEEDEFLEEGAWLLNPGVLNVRHETGRPTLLHSNSLKGTSPQLSLFPNGNQEQDLRILASL